jgi:hypothetical protein
MEERIRFMERLAAEGDEEALAWLVGFHWSNGLLTLNYLLSLGPRAARYLPPEVRQALLQLVIDGAADREILSAQLRPRQRFELNTFFSDPYTPDFTPRAPAKVRTGDLWDNEQIEIEYQGDPLVNVEYAHGRPVAWLWKTGRGGGRMLEEDYDHLAFEWGAPPADPFTSWEGGL